MVDILLIQPPIRDFYLTAKRTIPYGLASIAACLGKEGFTVEILDALAVSRSRIMDYPPEMAYLKTYYGRPDISPFSLFHDFRHHGYSLEHIGNVAKKSGAFLVGISSLFTPYSGVAIETAKRVKEVLPDCRVVLGGHHPTVMPKEVMACRSVDYILRGEGEVSMPLLAGAIQTGSAIDLIPGIVFRDPKDRITVSNPATIDILDACPPPAMGLIKDSYYKRGKKGSTVIVASRGCPLKCTYCAIGSSGYMKYRRRSVESVLREIERAVKRHNASFIDFEDEHLTLNRKWFMQLLEGITSRFSNAELELRAMNGLYPPSLDESMIRAMRTAGFKALNLSLGSLSLEQLKRFNRPDVKEALDTTLDLADRYGLETVVYIIAAAPGQSAEESLRDLLYVSQKKAVIGVSIYYPAPDSVDFRRCETFGILPRHLSLMRSSALPISDTTTRLEAATLLRLGRIVNFMKSLSERGSDIPGPTPYPEGLPLDMKNRNKIGKQLLRWFLDDGYIRGVTPDGAIYKHAISNHLTNQFIEALNIRE